MLGQLTLHIPSLVLVEHKYLTGTEPAQTTELIGQPVLERERLQLLEQLVVVECGRLGLDVLLHAVFARLCKN